MLAEPSPPPATTPPPAKAAPPGGGGTAPGSGRLRLVQVADTVLAGGGEAAAGMAKRMPADRERLTVVLAGPVAPVLPQLLEQLQDWVPQRWHAIRLVGDEAGVASGGPSPAQELADGLGGEVVAPNGSLLMVPDGSLFVLGRDPTRRGAWWRFRPFYTPEAMGPRFPVPAWETDLATFAEPGVPGVVVDEVPAGLWVHRPGAVAPTDLAFSEPAEPRSVVLLVSRPGDPPLHPDQLRRLVEVLPAAVRERLLLVPYGDRSVDDAPPGRVVATAIGHHVRVRTGLTLHTARGGREVVAVDRDSVPSWRPFVRELAWRPRHPTPLALRWQVPVAGLVPAGAAVYELSRSWVVEGVECGLWIRPADREGGATTVRAMPLEAAHCTVVVGVAGPGRVRPPWRAIAQLLRRLPANTRSRLRIAVLGDSGDRLARSAARVAAELGGRPVYPLTDSGADGGSSAALVHSGLVEGGLE